jgi:hypothetical protein
MQVRIGNLRFGNGKMVSSNRARTDREGRDACALPETACDPKACSWICRDAHATRGAGHAAVRARYGSGRGQQPSRPSMLPRRVTGRDGSGRPCQAGPAHGDGGSVPPACATAAREAELAPRQVGGARRLAPQRRQGLRDDRPFAGGHPRRLHAQPRPMRRTRPRRGRRSAGRRASAACGWKVPPRQAVRGLDGHNSGGQGEFAGDDPARVQRGFRRVGLQEAQWLARFSHQGF